MTSSTCGYCRRTGKGQSQKRRSYYARTNSMTAASYQALVDRNWRRSGTLLYKPNQRDACCPHYTLRLDSARFRPTRDQRQTINRFNRHIVGETYTREAARRYPKTREEARKRDSEFDLTQRIHESEIQLLPTPPEPAHQFEVTLETDDFTEEKYGVFENYQRIVHKEPSAEISRSGFRRFLCDSPLRRENVKGPNGKTKALGSYHQCYRLDGQLVAIGVLDLLPDSVSAVYFLYHESIHKWSPGKLGALREIALALEGGYGYWYPGFYIHTCPKMRYKIDYMPQELLNPDGMVWVDLSEELLAKFDSRGYLDFSKEDSKNTDTTTRQEEADNAFDIEYCKEDEGGSLETDGDDEDEDKDDDDGELSLLKSNMPGLPSAEKLASFDYNSIPVQLSMGQCSAGDLFDWGNEDIMTDNGPKSQIAQLVAVVGLDVMPSFCLDFRRS
ncbi:arginine-tRNA-protein transferase [Xylariaceae sp. FL0255]|nr:arginine-tRNA-protein transferase [Xylariaceae sp. FL0255]